MKLVTVEEMKQLEKAADANGHSYANMMEQAGRAVSVEIAKRMIVKGKIVLILVGPGNNGGDGLVAARYLKEAGAQIVCYLWKPRTTDDPNLKLIQERSIPCLYSNDDKNYDTLRKALKSADIIVDALLGTGVTRPIQGKLKDVLEVVREAVSKRRLGRQFEWTAFSPPVRPRNHLVPFVVAVDVPSGLNCDSGDVDPVTLPADLTVTFAAPKRGQFRFPGAGILGELAVADIGIAPALAQDLPIDIATAKSVGSHLPVRPWDAHKGTFGKAMIVAGSINYTGAPYLAAAAAARVGTGLVTLAPPQPLYTVLSTKLAEATFVLLAHSTGVLNENAVKILTENMPGYAALLVGPGLGQEKETVAFVHKLLGIGASTSKRMGFHQSQTTELHSTDLPPLVIDADALNALAQVETWWQHVPQNSILTPHPGEMMRLMGSQDKVEDRIAAAMDKAAEWKQILVLKGAHTIVAAPDGRTTLLPFVNPGLATAGTGDVLAGCIVGLLAQGLEPFQAAVCGAYLHGLAGERAVSKMGNAGTLASDLLPELPLAIASLK
ncbi:MAG: NAD(P)H-hydrate dehydratase [Anaerolineae bacterium]|nr:NAD(P)H-hydrate dehydratase [Anaerolineae bacterium]